MGAALVEVLDDAVDYCIIGSKRKKGRAQSIRQAESLAAKVSLTILDEDAFFYMLREDLHGVGFVFAGGFDFFPEHVVQGQSIKAVELVGGRCCGDVDDSVQYLVLGERRAKGKAAMLNNVKKHRYAGVPIRIIDEPSFLILMAHQLHPDRLDLQGFIIKAATVINPNRLKSALDMLKSSSFQLYCDLGDTEVTGIVQSHSGYAHGYSCALDSKGAYHCIDNEMLECMSQHGTVVCKHLLVMLLGLVRSGELAAEQAYAWLHATSGQSPCKSHDRLIQTWLRYKGVQPGGVDWRPTQTIPEDYCAF